MPQDNDRSAAVPIGRLTRLLRFGGIATGIAGGVAAGGLRAMAQGQRPDMAQLLLTPGNTLRLTEGLSHLRGAALKLGQMLSMDSGVMLPPELTSILARLRQDARHMPPKQLQSVLNAEWGPGWHKTFARFEVRPFAAASIGQVHRASLPDGRELAIKVQYPGVRDSIDSDVDNLATLLRLPGLLPRGMDLAPLLMRTAVGNSSTEAAAWCCCGRRKSRPPIPFLRRQGGREDLQRGPISESSPGLRGRHEPAGSSACVQHLA